MDRAFTWEDKIGQNSLYREFTKKVGKNDLHSNMCSNSTFLGVKTMRYKIFRKRLPRERPVQGFDPGVGNQFPPWEVCPGL